MGRNEVFFFDEKVFTAEAAFFNHKDQILFTTKTTKKNTESAEALGAAI